MATSAITGLTDEQQAQRQRLASERGQSFFGGLAEGVGSFIDPTDPLNYLGVAGKVGRGLFAATAGLRNTDAQALIGGNVAPELAARASNMLSSGASPGRIFQETGLSRVPISEGKFTWGKTIDDTGASVNQDTLAKLKDNVTKVSLQRQQVPVENILLKDVLNHPSLYKEYPEIGNIRMEQVNGFQAMGGVQGFYDAAAGLMGMKKLNPYMMKPEQVASQLKELTSTLLHESQHAIQNIEKWPRGGSSTEFSLESTKKAEEQVNWAKKSLDQAVKSAFVSAGQKPPIGGLDNLMQSFVQFQNEGDKALKFLNEDTVRNVKFLADKNIGKQFLETYGRINKTADKVATRNAQAFEKYKNIAGEAQARAAQNQFSTGDYRFDFTTSYDKPIENLIYRDPFPSTVK